jgi:protein-S-isoprenylcysteine O-methyltransferase Ste14
MLWRAIFAFVALPGIVAFAVPLAFAGCVRPFPSQHAVGLVPLSLGVLLLWWCVREFYVEGRGTLAPWAPPTHLVTSGPYRYCRNPMYVSVALILLGWAILYWLRTLFLYAACVAVASHLRVVFFEEPWAARTFGDPWISYIARTPRWFL